ncbi:hypothetical protein [Lentimicrobium sp. S6]|uniref:hypothetical protein n=1 Tax=Lentimicrobium sp. S6 TaxID=2735872 RepID=UPI0015560510|nr:hypothetical protein [Lentimicrobium sp. S6]NPD44658.1 hypothetical protein [Lentimicrobium sp. S6]
MKEGNKKNECICLLPLLPHQYEPICTEDGETFRRWSCSCGRIGEEHYDSDLNFIGMFNFYKPVKDEIDLNYDDVDFFDLDDYTPFKSADSDFFDID